MLLDVAQMELESSSVKSVTERASRGTRKRTLSILHNHTKRCWIFPILKITKKDRSDSGQFFLFWAVLDIKMRAVNPSTALELSGFTHNGLQIFHCTTEKML